MARRVLHVFVFSGVSTLLFGSVSAFGAPSATGFVVESIATSPGSISSATVSADGVYYVSDGNKTVYEVDPETGSVSTFNTGGASDVDTVRMGPDGEIVVSGVPVTAYDAGASVLWSAKCGYGNPQGLDVGPDGTVYMANNKSFCVIVPDGTASPAVASLGSYSQVTQAVAYGPSDGYLYASFGLRSTKSSWNLGTVDLSSGSLLSSISTSTYQTVGLDFDLDDNLVLVDKVSNSIKVRVSGTLTTVASGFSNINDVQVGPEGELVVVDVGTSQLYVLWPDEDEDEVRDLEDGCPGSTTGALVDGGGCDGWQSVDLICGDSGDWSTTGEYVSCVTRHAHRLVRDGLFTSAEASALISSVP